LAGLSGQRLGSRVNLSHDDIRCCAPGSPGRPFQCPRAVNQHAYIWPMQTIYHTLIPTLWLLWLAGWVISGLRTKQVARAESIASRLSHLIPLGLGIALLVS